MSVAFRYRVQRPSGPELEASVGDEIILDERIQYVLSFDEPYPPTVRTQIEEAGGDPVGPTTAILTFRNYVGLAHLAGVAIRVTSSKLGPDGVGILLGEVSDLSSQLVFGRGSPTDLAAGSSKPGRSPVPYHRLQFLRRALLGDGSAGSGRMPGWLTAIQRTPTRRFAQDRPVVTIDRVRHLDQQAVAGIFSSLDRLSPLGPASLLGGSPLAKALTFGSPARAHMPTQVAAPLGRLSFDTPENRFVRHVIGECQTLVHRFSGHARIDARLREDCRRMAAALNRAATHPVLSEAGRLTSLGAPSQALMKAEGYRDVFAFWLSMGRHVSLPLDASETARFLEGRNIATLYEYWVFVRVLRVVYEILDIDSPDTLDLRTDELGTSLTLGLVKRPGSAISVSFNPSFNRSGGGAYSTPLRPDVVLAIGDRLHAFDAKYRLDRIDAGETGEDDGDDTGTYKRADLYKMHTYRDAIHRMRTAFVVYPGSEFVFFSKSGIRLSDPADVPVDAEGVGAVTLRPSDPTPDAGLRTLLGSLIPDHLKRP